MTAAKVTVFFDDYQRFLETSQVFAQRKRLNLRHEALITANRDIIAGARVLDIASHDGRWSFAALRTGAAHVTGIEARQGFVDNARETFSHYGEDPDTFRFICGDVFDVLGREEFDVDVVLCLGYFYHTYRHTELLHHIRSMDPKHVIIDSNVVPDAQQPYVRVVVDRPENAGQATLDEYSYGQQTLVSLPSVPALRMMLQAYDFEVEDCPDRDALRAVYALPAYKEDKRVILRCRSGSAGPEEPLAGRVDTEERTRPASPQYSPAVGAPPSQGNGEVGSGPVQVRNGARWRSSINRVLAKATGYELRRAVRSR